MNLLGVCHFSGSAVSLAMDQCCFNANRPLLFPWQWTSAVSMAVDRYCFHGSGPVLFPLQWTVTVSMATD